MQRDIAGPISIQPKYCAQVRTATVIGCSVKCAVGSLNDDGLWGRTIGIRKAVQHLITRQIFAALEDGSVPRTPAVKGGPIKCAIAPLTQPACWITSIAISPHEIVQHREMVQDCVARTFMIHFENRADTIAAAGMSCTIKQAIACEQSLPPRRVSIAVGA